MNMPEIRITPPLSDIDIKKIKSGDRLLITGIVYAARDAAHRRMAERIERGEELPFDIRGQIIYYMGPAPARPGTAVGSAGPTTSGRMDRYSPALIKMGLKGMIGKGPRSEDMIRTMREYGCLYMAAVGGAGALLSRRIKSSTVIAWEDMGAEALRRMEVVDFPVIVVNDSEGRDLYRESVSRYRIDG
ncbi:MAG: fumarate hydratase [Spirochaetes bacterium RBG_13_51_14]|nr:MAG: fumarate hydratase [Spirochaetes bacterium RBG_13_51_14]